MEHRFGIKLDIRVLLVILSLQISGCAEKVNNAEQVDFRYQQLFNISPSEPIIIPRDELSCKAAGYRWGQFGIPGGGDSCAVWTSDYLKICTDSSQCQGECLVEKSIANGVEAVGSCSRWIAVIGCNKMIQNNQVVHICMD